MNITYDEIERQANRLLEQQKNFFKTAVDIIINLEALRDMADSEDGSIEDKMFAYKEHFMHMKDYYNIYIPQIANEMLTFASNARKNEATTSNDLKQTVSSVYDSLK